MSKKIFFLTFLISSHFFSIASISKKENSRPTEQFINLIEKNVGKFELLVGSGLGLAGLIYLSAMSSWQLQNTIVWLRELCSKRNGWETSLIIHNATQAAAKAMAIGVLAVMSGKISYTLAKKTQSKKRSEQ